MKINLTICFAFLFASSLFAHNGDLNTPKSPSGKSNSTSLVLNKIFFSDVDNALLFVDFEAIQDQIINVNILRDSKMMMEDDVSDLPDNTIYEINLDIIREGTYTVELVTADGIKIHKEIWVE